MVDKILTGAATITGDREPRLPSSACEYPRTLVVGGMFSEHYGTGIYLKRIFSMWPKERLACAGRNTCLPDFSRCSRFYRLGIQEFHPPSLARSILPNIQSGPIAIPENENMVGISAAGTPVRKSRLIQFRSRVRRVLGGGDILYRAHVSRQLLEWIQDFKPEVIYGLCSTPATAQFLCRIQRAIGLPLVLHCMDDFAEGHYRAGWSKALDGYLFRREFNRLMQSASGVIAICKEMAQEYQTRYKRPVTWIDMPADVSAYEKIRRTNWTQGNEFKIRYGGRVGWGIQSCIAEMAIAVHELRQEGHPIIFDIVRTNTTELPEACLRADGVRVLPPQPLSQVPNALAQADALLVCYDFDQQSYREARFSMPSKLPECMASGTPVIVFGPAGLPVVEYARHQQWGVVIDSNNIQVVKDALRQLMRSEAARERFGTMASELAERNHSAHAVSQQLNRILNVTTQVAAPRRAAT